MSSSEKYIFKVATVCGNLFILIFFGTILLLWYLENDAKHGYKLKVNEGESFIRVNIQPNNNPKDFKIEKDKRIILHIQETVMKL